MLCPREKNKHVALEVYNFSITSPATPFRGQRPHKTNKTL